MAASMNAMQRGPLGAVFLRRGLELRTLYAARWSVITVYSIGWREQSAERLPVETA